MTTYGYVRTSVAGSDPESQALRLRGAGVEPTNIFRDLAVSGRVGAAGREGWHALDERMEAGDTPDGGLYRPDRPALAGHGDGLDGPADARCENPHVGRERGGLGDVP